MSRRPTLEVIALGAEDARRAQEGGADRIELCASMETGGLTPPLETVEAVVAACPALQIAVMVRPRPGDFCYSPSEVTAMLRTIESLNAFPLEGYVLGVLTPEGKINAAALRELVAASGDRTVVFHRAFDLLLDPGSGALQLAELGVRRVLTFGYPFGASRRPICLARVCEAQRAVGQRLRIMTGGLLPTGAVRSLLRCGVWEFHLGRAVRVAERYDAPIAPEAVGGWRALLDQEVKALSSSR